MKKLIAVLFLLSLLFCQVSPSYAQDAVKGDVIVVLRNTSGVRISSAKSAGGIQSLSTVQSFTRSVNATVTQTYDALSEQSGNIFMVLHSDTKNENDLLREVRKNPNVIASSLNWVSQLCADQRIPNDPEYYRLWGMEEINAPDVWNISTGSDDVYVAVMDSGVDYNHPDLKDNFSHKFSRNFTITLSAAAGKDYDERDYTDYNDHGTHVSGTIAGVGNNQIGVAGVNWKAKIISLRVGNAQGQIADADIVYALNYLVGLLAANPKLNLAAVNMSLSGYHPYSPSEATAQNDPYYLAVKALSDMNRTLICASAGNNNVETAAPVMNTNYNALRAVTLLKGSYSYPAAFQGIDNMIVVGASTSEHIKASYSNYSSNFVHVSAPGGNAGDMPIFSTIRTTKNGKERALPYGGMSGTSMSTPHVTGTAALLKAIYPEATPRQIKAAILGGANSEYLTGSNISMYGLLDIRGAVNFLSETLAGNTPPKITASKLHNPIPKQPYKFELTASGTQPITWSVEGNLPAGLSLDADGIITGVVEEGSLSEFVITAENDYGYDSMVFTLSADNGVPPVISTMEIAPGGYTGLSYDFTASISEGTWPIFWSVGSSDMPSGFGLSYDREAGTVTFTPTTAGTYHFTLKAENCAGSDTKEYGVTVKESSAPVIISNNLPSGVTGMTYGYTTAEELSLMLSFGFPTGGFVTAEGASPVSFDVTGLPAGLSFDSIMLRTFAVTSPTAFIHGIPQESGDFTVTVTASNAFGTASKDFSLHISDDYKPVFLQPPSSYTMQKGFSFSDSLLYIAKPPAEIIYDGLPEGITVDAVDASESPIAGVLAISVSGIPTKTGTYNVILTVSTDTGSTSHDIAVTVTEPAVITTNFLPDAVKGVSYDVRLSSFGGAALSWTVSSDTPLPAGLTLSESGDLRGIPTQAGNFRVIVIAKLNDFASGKRSFALIVRELPSVKTSSLSDGTMNTPYSRVTLSADGTAPITWSVSSGDFPAGLTLTSNGYIFGTPTKSGAFAFTLRASNGAGHGDKAFTVNIASDGSDSGDITPDSKDIKPDSGDIKPDSKDIKPEATIKTGSSRGVSSLTVGEISSIAQEGGLIAAVLPEITVSVSDFYTYKSVDIFASVKLSDDVPAGYVLKWHPFTRSLTGAMIEATENDSESAEFCDSDGNIITDVPANRVVNVSAWLEAGKTYAPVISAVSKNPGNSGVGSSSGGCDSVSLGLSLLGAVMTLFTIRTKKR